jgi:ABC-type glycerol-3-phosphate transport system substrate-binding protein
MAMSSRRRFLGLVGTFGVGALVAACSGPVPTPAPPSSAPASGAAPAPTQAPAAAAPKPAEATKPAAAPAAAAPVTNAGAKIVVRWQNRSNDAAIKAANDYIAQTFAKDKPNIEISVEPAPDNRDEKLIAAMVGGNAPDVFETWSDNVTQFADRGQVLDVEPYSKRDYSADELKDFFAWQWRDLVLPSGIRFGVPKYVNVMVNWMNVDAFEKAGIKLPDDKTWTHDEYAELARKLTKKNGDVVDQWGLGYPIWSWDRYWYKIEAFGGEVVDPKDTTAAKFDSDNAMKAWEWSRKLMWDDKAMAQRLMLAPQGQSADLRPLFGAGKFAMVEDGFYPFAMADAVQKKFKWVYMHTPQGPSGKKRVLGTTDAFSQWKGSKNLDQGWEVLKFLAAPGYQENVLVKASGSLPIRFSVLDKWKKICIEKYPELEAVNLDIGKQAMEMGYAGNRIFFKKDAEARKIIQPAIEKVYIAGGTPVSYFKDIAKEVNTKMKE